MVVTPEQARKSEAMQGVVDCQLAELVGLFGYAHLPARLQVVSKPFGELALRLLDPSTLTLHSFELVEALRNLLRAKDAACRALILSDRVCGAPGVPGPEGKG